MFQLELNNKNIKITFNFFLCIIIFLTCCINLSNQI